MKKLFFKYVALFLIVSMANTVKAQPSEPGYPAGLYYDLPSSGLPVILLPYFNNEELMTADTCESCGEKYGVDANVSFDFWQVSQVQLINNGFDKVEVYRVKVVSPTAKALHVVFSHFELEPNASIFFYSPFDTNRVLGAYSVNNNKPDLSFISNSIDSNEVIIEVNRKIFDIPQAKGTLMIRKFVHVFKNRLRFQHSLDCHENVICAPWYNEWCNEIRSVVKFVYHRSEPVKDSGWYACSGVLLNNTNNNFDPIVLTADHCGNGGDEHENWIFYFNFQSITCNPSTNGNDLMTVTGVDVIAVDDGTFGCPDMALMRLRQGIPLQYNAFFSSWNRGAYSSLPDDDIAVGIHHPSGDIKKFSQGERNNPLLSTCIRVNWDIGYTEGGSSGSPLFVSTREVVGVLSWGWHEEDDCEDDANFFYSKLSQSWSDMQPHLAPGNPSALTHLGIDPISACQSIIDLNRTFFPGNDWQVKNEIIIQATQQVNIANITPTVISNSPLNYFTPRHNADYVIRSGGRITINPGFRINAPNRLGSGVYTTFFQFGNQNRASFQISPCTPFIDDCGFNHENALVLTNPAPNVQDNLANNLQSDASSVYGVYIYPNPANNTLHIEFSEEISQGSFVIYSLMGSKVKEGKLSSSVNTTDISRLSEGLYIIQIRAADRIVNYKFVVAR